MATPAEIQLINAQKAQSVGDQMYNGTSANQAVNQAQNNLTAEQAYQQRLATTGGYTVEQIKAGQYPKTITSANLAPATPLAIPSVDSTTYKPPVTTPPPPTGTTTDANGNAIVATTQPNTQDLIKTQFQKLGETLGTKGQVTADLQDQQKLAEKTLQATQDYNAYNQAKLDLQHQIDAVAGSGLPDVQRQAKVAEISRIGNANLANLAVVAQASQGLLSSAEKTIKDKLDAQFQPIQDQIDYLTKFSSLNANDLTEKEKYLLQQKADEKKTGLSQITQVADALHQAMLQNGAPISTYSAMDKISNDFVAGKITAQDAMSKMYQTVGTYGVDVAKKLQQEKLRADILATENTIPSASKEVVGSDAQDVLEGRNTLFNIRQTMGRSDKASAYMKSLRDSIRSKDPQFDFVASDAGGKSVSTSYVQRATASINAVLPNVDHIIQLSNDVDRIGVKGVDKLIQGANLQIGDKPVSSLKQAQLLIADEIGVALGAGTVSDMKLQLGFDVTDPTVKPEVFANNMEIVKSFLENRKKGLESLRYKSSTVNTNTPVSGGSVYNGIMLPN